MRELRRLVLVSCGTLALGLGVLGMFLPLLPTTVFLLVAAYCYARSSPRLHRWLLTNRYLGGYLRSYREGRGMPLKHKIMTLLLLWGAIAFSVAVTRSLWLRLLLLAVAVGVTAYLVRIKSDRPARRAMPGLEGSS